MPGSRFPGGWTPKSDPRVIYSLCRVGNQLFFLNHGHTDLSRVVYTAIGTASGDFPGDPGLTTKPLEISYDNVLPEQAILVDEFDEYFDCDFLVIANIIVHLNGKIESFSVAGKGGPRTQVLKRS